MMQVKTPASACAAGGEGFLMTGRPKAYKKI